jgi:hypothetical protein
MTYFETLSEHLLEETKTVYKETSVVKARKPLVPECKPK